MNLDRLGRSLWWIAAAVTVVVISFSAFVLFRPLPARELVLATGLPGSAYAEIGERYRASLAKQGVRLLLRPTAGSIEDLKLLNDPRSGVDAGFVQSGTTSTGASPDLLSLGAVFDESVWFFCRCESRGLAFQDLVGRKLSIGPEGSGSRAVALKLLELNRVDTSRLTLLALAPDEAATKLLDGTIDAAVILAWWDSPVVRKLLASPDVNLVGFPRADAYVALFPFLDKVVIPMGVGNLALNRPSEDVTLLRAKASLVVRTTLDPALQYLLVEAAQSEGTQSRNFELPGTYPVAVAIDLPLSSEARRYYKSGPSLLQRHLPFWLAELVERLAVGLLPIFGVLYPVWSLAPKVIAWYMQHRIDHHYVELKRLEREIESLPPGAPVDDLLERLTLLERRVVRHQPPAPFAAAKFQLRAHIAQMAQSLRARALDRL